MIGALDFVNLVCGKDLYDVAAFRVAGVTLRYLDAVLPIYDQGQDPFVGGLSILDVLAHVAPDTIASMAQGVRLTKAAQHEGRGTLTEPDAETRS